MLYSEEEVKANIRNRDGKRVFYLGKGHQLTSGARDYLSRERIPILPAEQARPEKYRLISGGFCEEKPEHLTHLNGEVLVPKTHPRIAFRGMMDLLEAEIMLCQLAAPDQKAQLEELLGFARMIVRCDVLEEPFGVDRLCGLTEDALRQRSHRPQDYYGQAHFMPGVGDGEEILRLNRLRCVARQAELAAVDAFSDREGRPTRPDILKAMNRMSSMVWIMMIEMKKKL
jgi:ethanolamine utilization cobalamin adenosyltransferase